jgi:hypothetical protein
MISALQPRAIIARQIFQNRQMLIQAAQPDFLFHLLWWLPCRFFTKVATLPRSLLLNNFASGLFNLATALAKLSSNEHQDSQSY